MRDLIELYTTARPGWPPPNVLTYNALLIACLIYAWLRGGAPEKAAASILTIGSLLSRAAAFPWDARYASVETGILIVDLACMAAFVALALRADRYWPLWLAALQVAGTSVHVVKFLDPDITRTTYVFLLVIWAYPMIALICLGTWRHQQRLARLGVDRSWSR